MQETTTACSGTVDNTYTHTIPQDWFRETPVGDIMSTVSTIRETSPEILLASHMKYFITLKKPISQLIQYCVDIAADQFTAEEFYQSHPEILVWLAKAGSTDEEVQVRAFIHLNPQIFVCRVPGCGGNIVGGCPKLYCETCGEEYILYLGDVSERMCDRCVASNLGECTLQSRRTRIPIYGIPEED